MLTEVELNLGSGGAKITVDSIGGSDYEVVKSAFGSEGTAIMVDPANPMPVNDTAVETVLTALAAEDFATAANQATGNALLNSILAKILASPATESTLASVLAKLIVNPATDTLQTTGNNSLSTIAGKDFATQTTLSALLAKVVTSPALESKQDTANNSLSAIDTKLAAPTTILNGQTTVTTAGTRVVLAASTSCKSVTIKAFITNTGIIYVGNSTVTSSNGFRLNPGDSVSLDISNLNTVNLDTSVSGSQVSYIAIN